MSIFYNNLQDDLLDFSMILQTTLNDASLFLREVSSIYGTIGKKFPDLEISIQRENENAMKIVNYFSGQEDDSHNFSVLLRKSQDEFSSTLKSMKNFIGLDVDLSNSIVESVAKVDNVVKSIEEIKLLADQIKIYSLNAIVTSSKYGVKGQAFGEISKNIIKLSDSSNSEADNMSNVGKDLFNKFKNFESEMSVINKEQDDSFISINQNIDDSFSKILGVFNNFSSILSNIIERVDSTKTKIFDIMISLQKEDIIRQQTEHIIETIDMIVVENKGFVTILKEFNSEDSDITDEQRKFLEQQILDLLTFNDVVLSLIMHNFDDIAQETEYVNDHLRSTLISMKNAILDISGDKDIIIEHFMGGQKSGSFSLVNHVFDIYTSCMKGYTGNMKRTLSDKDNVLDKNADIDDILNSLEEMFYETKSIASTFNSINFLAKIELEKNDDLFQDSQVFSVRNVETIALNITNTVEKCLEEFEVIKIDLFSSLDVFKVNMKNQKSEYAVIQSSVDFVEKILHESKDAINENIKTLDNYSIDLVNLIDATILDMDSLGTLMSEINSITSIYKDIVSRMKIRKETVYKDFGIVNWKLKNDKFLNIIEKYTIEKERSIADSVLSETGSSDINIDIGSSNNNDVIFF